MSSNVKPKEMTKTEVYSKHHCGYLIHHTNLEDKTRLIGQFVY